MKGLAILFDLDGVLADFVGGALMYHGRTDIRHADVRWAIEAQLGLDPAAFWRDLGYGFWASLPVLPDGLALLTAAQDIVGWDRIGLLTSPCDTNGCIDGKRAWVEKHAPQHRRRLFVGSAKELFAGPTKVLIDDHDGNVEKFQAAGGLVVQPPRPWNARRAECVNGHEFDVAKVVEELRTVVEVAGGRRAA
jgi:hypothetical protein